MKIESLKVVKNELFIGYSYEGDDNSYYPIIPVKDISVDYIVKNSTFPKKLYVNIEKYNEVEKMEMNIMNYVFSLMPYNIMAALVENLETIIIKNYVFDSDYYGYHRNHDLISICKYDLQTKEYEFSLQIALDFILKETDMVKKYISLYSEICSVHNTTLKLKLKSKIYNLGIISSDVVDKRTVLYTDNLMLISCNKNIGETYMHKTFLCVPCRNRLRDYKHDKDRKYYLNEKLKKIYKYNEYHLDYFKNKKLNKIDEEVYEILTNKGIMLFNVSNTNCNISLSKYHKGLSKTTRRNTAKLYTKLYTTPSYIIMPYSRTFCSEDKKKRYLFYVPNFHMDFFLNKEFSYSDSRSIKRFEKDYLEYYASKKTDLTHDEYSIFLNFHEAVYELARILNVDISKIFLNDNIKFI